MLDLIKTPFLLFCLAYFIMKTRSLKYTKNIETVKKTCIIVCSPVNLYCVSERKLHCICSFADANEDYEQFGKPYLI